MSANFTERATLIGPHGSLVGILTRPASPEAARGVAVVILNTGIIHRVGHHRVWVTLSRRLAGEGHAVLRFDFSGIGDSPARGDGLPPLEACMSDLREALDWLEQECLVTQVVLVGLCAGADHAVLYGHTDTRVAGLVLIDPSIPATTRFFAGHMLPRLLSLQSWMNFITGRSRLRLWLLHLATVLAPIRRAQPLTVQTLQTNPALEGIYCATVERNIRLLGVFSGHSDRQNYREQMIDAFPKVDFGKLLTLERFEDSDHLFSLDADRTRLIDLVSGWVCALGAPTGTRGTLPQAGEAKLGTHG